MNKKVLGITLGLVLLLAVSVFAYQMLSVRSRINVVESQTLQYYEGGVWKNFPLGTGTTLNLGTADMPAGSTTTFYVQGINSANRPVMYTLIIDSAYEDLMYGVVCNGVSQYAIIGGGEFGEGLTVVVLNGAGLTSGLGMTTTINAGAEITTGYLINPITSISRGEVEDYDWETCA